ncbi:MAG TPA: Ig-like domain-containing protein [Myxococcales bacterium]
MCRFTAALVLLAAGPAAAAPFTWTGAGATRSWTDAGNWAGGAVPADDGTADITISAIGNLSLDGVRVVSTLAVSAPGDVTLQPGSRTDSALVLRGAGLLRSTRGRLTAQVPIRSAGDVSLTGFEPQAALSTGTIFALGTDAWSGAAAVSQAIVQASGDALPPAGALSLGAGAWLDLDGRTVAVGSLAGAGTVTNTVAGEADLIVGLDGTDTTFSGVLGGKLADQVASNNLNLLKVGAGTLTLTGTNVLGNAYARVAGGALVVNGALVSAGGGYNYMVVESPGTLRGTGAVGNIWTGYANPAGAVIAPGTAASRGVLHCASADLTNAALQVRIAGYATAGVDYDQLDAGAGALVFGGDTDLVLDLAGLPSPPPPANRQTIVIATYGAAPSPVPAQRIRLINNPNGFGASFNYGVKSLSVTISPTPNPAPLFAVTPAHGLITSESGRSATLTVALGKQPGATVTLPVASSDTTEAAVSPASLVFTPSNWATPQTVTVAGVADAAADGNQRYSIALGPAISTDPSFSNQSAPAVTGVNLDDDLITVSPGTGLISVPPPGAAPSATVTFHLQPLQDFWLALVSSDPALGSPSPGVVHVAASGLGIPAPVQIAFPGMHRMVAGCEPYTVRAVIVASADPRFDGYQLPDIALCNQGDAAPVATADSLAVDQGSSVAIAAPGVLGNDFDPDGDALAASLVAGPAHGTASLSADGALTYTPAPGYSGSDAFTYQAGDGALGSGPVAVQVTVNDLAPAAADDAYTLAAGGTLSVAAPGVIANDTDPGGDVLSAQLVQDVARGTLTLFANGAFAYAAAPGFTGTDSFTYRVSDGLLSSAAATVVLAVTDAAPDLARLQLTSEGGTRPGAMVAYRASVTNLALQDLSGARLSFAPAGLAVVSATVGGAPMQQQAGTFQLPALAAGAGIDITIVAQVIAPPGSRAGVAAALWTGDGRPLGGSQEMYFSVARLQFDAGGCGCRGTNAGGALAWLGAIAAFLSRRRRRPASQRPS